MNAAKFGSISQWISLSLGLFIFRGLIINAFYYAAIILFIGYVLSIKNIKHFKISNLIRLLKVFSPFILVSISFIISFLFSKTKPDVIFNEVITVVYIYLIVLLMFLTVDSNDQFKLFIKSFENLYFILFAIISVFWFIQFISPLKFDYILNSELGHVALGGDHNMAAMLTLINLVLLIRLIQNAKNISKLKLFALNILFIINTLIIIISGSRRAWFLYLILLLVLIFYKKPIKTSLWRIKYALVFIGMIMVFSIFYFTSSPVFRNHLLSNINDVNFVRNTITESVVKFNSILGIKTNFQKADNYLWGDKNTKLVKWSLFKKKLFNKATDLTDKGLVYEAIPYWQSYYNQVGNEKFYSNADNYFQTTSDTIFKSEFNSLIPFIVKSDIKDFSAFCLPLTTENSKIVSYTTAWADKEVYLLQYSGKKSTCSGRIIIPSAYGLKMKLSFIIQCKSPNISFPNKNFQIKQKRIINIDDNLYQVNLILISKSKAPFESFYIKVTDDTVFSMGKFELYGLNTPILNENYYLNNIKEFNYYKNWIKYNSIRFNDYITKFEKVETKVPINNKLKKNIIDKLKNANYAEFYSLQNLQQIKDNGLYGFKVKYNATNTRLVIKIPAISKSKVQVTFFISLPDVMKFNCIIPLKNETNNIQITQDTINSQKVFKVSYSGIIENNTNGYIPLYINFVNAKHADTIWISNYYQKFEIDNTKPTINEFQLEQLTQFVKSIQSQEKEKERIALLTDKNTEQYSLDDNFISSRLLRWNLAIDYFKSYPMVKKCFGNGFEFLKVFPDKLISLNRKDMSIDSPHNPYLSAMLYAGIVGLILLLILTLYLFKYAFIYRNYLGGITIGILIVYFFAFFSGKTFFSFPVLLLFNVFIFFKRYLMKELK